MNREMSFNPEGENFSGESSGEQKTPEQTPRGLTDQEKATLVAKETAKVFKEVLDPKAAIKKVKDFFRK